MRTTETLVQSGRALKAKNNLARDTKALRYGMGVKTVGHDAKLNVDITAPFIACRPEPIRMCGVLALNHVERKESQCKFLQFYKDNDPSI
jgi:hypothetical protein